MKNFILLVFLVLVTTNITMAGEFNIPNTFVASTPALASEVNGNFSAAKTAIDDNNSRIEALESALAALEAQNSGFNGGDLTSSVYCFINYGSELTGGADPGVYTSHSNVVLTFTSSTQVSITSTSDVDAFLNTATGVIGTGTSSGGPAEVVNYTVSGSTLTLIGVRDDGGDNSYHLTPDGNVLIGDNASETGNNHEADLSIAVKADSC